ncbi:MAG: oxygen-independent coproporphyrinogen III oxidase [Lachnospiraceae bacterium]|nr:oxygen-independent coproporphyrinogen III oxidase [Lachnospiraceae bacterium]
MEQKKLSLYIHIPFCVKKCAYCDFLSMPMEEKTRNKYVEMLLREIRQEGVFYQDYVVDTVFFGGGTPTILSTEQLAMLLKELRESFCFAEPEITIECNPGTVDKEALAGLKNAGFNRLSIGLQSADNKELKCLGRIHTWEDFLQTYEQARAAGFENINIDLMSALPGQTIESYQNTLQKVLELKPEHISAYSLMIEEETPFYDLYSEGGTYASLLPSEDTERAMYDLTEQLLSERGYARYEISNYALPGKQCRHNIVYWKRGNYLGLGLGAASLVENVRFHKEEELDFYFKSMGKLKVEETDFEFQQNKYLSNTYKDRQVLTKNEQMEEFMFLGLRMMEGVNKADFKKQFHVALEDVYRKSLQRLERQELIKVIEDRIMLTSKGVDVSNVALAEFLL